MVQEQEYQELMQEIQESSPYKKKPSVERTMISVKEMGDLLGLKKTERYWLLHKNYFKNKVILGKTWVDLESFEKWYANQVKYHKITGEEPGKELKKWSYSVHDLSKLLDLEESGVYDLIKREKIETVQVDYWMRIPKRAFYEWYRNQSRYRTTEDRRKDAEVEAASITMPEMARLLGVTRGCVYAILQDPRYKHFFEIIVVAERKRITKESFQNFLDGQKRYSLDPKNDYPEVALEQNRVIANYRRRVLAKSEVRRHVGNQEYLTRKEAAILAGVAPNTISLWCAKEYFSCIHIQEELRIVRYEFEQWLEKRKEMEA